MPSQNLTFANSPTTFNLTTWNDPSLCTLETCPKNYAAIRYIPSLPANAFFLACFAAMLAIQLFLGSQRRTWTFLVAMVGGLVLEVIGYTARVLLHENVFVFDYFLMCV